MVGKHDVLVATARADRESSHVVGEEFADGVRPDVQFFGGRGGSCWWGWGKASLGFGGAQTCRTWVRWPLMVSLLEGQNLEALA